LSDVSVARGWLVVKTASRWTITGLMAVAVAVAGAGLCWFVVLGLLDPDHSMDAPVRWGFAGLCGTTLGGVVVAAGTRWISGRMTGAEHKHEHKLTQSAYGSSAYGAPGGITGVNLGGDAIMGETHARNVDPPQSRG
jgi:hypothetical protein